MRTPAFTAVIPFAVGIVAAYLADASPALLLALLAASLLVCVRVVAVERAAVAPRWQWSHQLPFWAMLLLAGAFRYEWATARLPANHISSLALPEQNVRLVGRVVSEPEPRPSGTVQAVLEAQRMGPDGGERPVSGKVLLTVRPADAGLDFGDWIAVEGRIRRPSPARNPGAFDYGKWLARKGVYGFVSVGPQAIGVFQKETSRGLRSRGILPIRRSMRRSIERNLSGPPAAFVKGVLLGDRSGISPQMAESFARTGTAHVLAISGLHVGLIAAILFFVFKLPGLPERGAVAGTIAALALYALVVDLRPSVVRAVTMASVVLAGMVIERNTSTVNSLFLAALGILAVWPQSLFDVGFQLSFAAVLSIVLLYGPLLRVFPEAWRRPEALWDKGVLGALAVSAAAHLGTSPILAYHFSRVPLISLVGNLPVIPLVSVALALGFGACAFGPWLPAAATAFNGANWVVVQSLLGLVRRMSEVPHAALAVASPSGPAMVVCFALLGLTVKAAHTPRYRKALLFALLVAANGMVWKGPLRERDVLKVTFLDVGEGDAIFVEFPNGRSMLVDGGDRWETFDAGRQTIEPFLCAKGVEHLDAVVATHGDRDHIGGLPSVLKRFRVDHLVDNGQPASGDLGEELVEWAERRNVSRHTVSAGDSLLGFGEVHAVVLHPTKAFVAGTGPGRRDSNNASVVLKLSYHNVDLLLTGDIEEEAEEALLRWGKGLDADVLKVPHHGSATSSTNRFLDAVRPRWAVVSAGGSAWREHPAPSVLKCYAQRGIALMRTDRHGAVMLTVSDGGMKIRSMLGPRYSEQGP